MNSSSTYFDIRITANSLPSDLTHCWTMFPKINLCSLKLKLLLLSPTISLLYIRHIQQAWRNDWCASCTVCTEMPEVRWLQLEWNVHCESGSSPKLLSDPPTVHHGSGNPLSRVSYRISRGKPVSRWPGRHLWIAGRSTRQAFPLEVRWWLWTSIHHKRQCCIGQIQLVLAHTHLLSLYHHLQRKSWSVHQKRQIYLICIACNIMIGLWSSGGAVSLPRTKLYRNIWRGNSLTIWWRCPTPVKWHSHVERSGDWLKKVQKLYT